MRQEHFSLAAGTDDGTTRDHLAAKYRMKQWHGRPFPNGKEV